MAEQIVQIINNLVGQIQNPEIQKQAEESLNLFSSQNPNEFVQYLIQILKNSQNEQHRVFVASHLRKITSKFAEKSFVNIWDQLNVESQQLIQTQLFECLKTEPVQNIRYLISDCIGELAGSLLEDPQNNKWPELVPLLWQLFMQSNTNLIESGFKILVNLLTFASDTFEKSQNELKNLFQNGIQNENVKISVACIQALGAYLSVLEPKQAKGFQYLIPQMLNTLYKVLKTDQDEGQLILEVFTDIVETEPKFFKENFEQLFSTVWKINMEEKEIETDIKHMGTETLISLVQRLPQIVRKNQEYLLKLIELIFSHMIEIDQEVTDEWKQPPEGFNEDIEEDADFETTRFGMNAIDRIIDSVGDKETLPILSQTVEKLLQHADWRYNYAAIMALSQVGEYIDDVATVQPIMDVVLKFLSSPNPVIRYGVFHAIGQISDDMKPEFQTVYKDSIMKVILQHLDDPVPRVASHAAAALTNFVEGFTEQDVQPYLQVTLEKLFALVNSGCSIVKENCMTAIASTAEAAKEHFHAYFDISMPILFKVFDAYKGKEYKQLRGQTIECITLIAHSVSKEKFLPYLDQITNIIINIQESNLDNQDPQKTYVLSGWQRLCLKYNVELTTYLPKILPGVFKIVSQIIKKDACDSDEAEVALAMLEVFIDQFGSNYVNYVEETTKLISPLCSYKYSESIRDQASKCLPGLIKCAQQQPETQKNMVRYFLGLLWDAASSEFDSEIIISQITAMKECIESCGKFMTQQEIQSLSDKVIKLLLDSDKRKAENEKWKNEEDVEDEEKNILEEDLKIEENLQVSIAELIGVLFKTHKEQTLNLAHILYTQVLPKVMDSKVSDNMHKFGLFLIDDMVEFLGFEHMGDKWGEFAQALSIFAVDKSSQVRQAAVYGIGIFAQVTPTAQFSVYAQGLVKTLLASIAYPQGSEKEKTYGHAKDNAISSLGKIIRYQSESLSLNEILGLWLNNLPLKFDKQEGVFQHRLLAELTINRPDLITQNEGFIQKTIVTFGQVLGTKFVDQEGTALIHQAINRLTQVDFVKNNWNSIVANLTDGQKVKLQQGAQAQ
ncbi:hypothetical protein IMG5_116170 [Ichthyophthirius multifiliis]|uniref:Importin N-terminal domain-containing protein n=1 Tax=Ichthyophthirius multifiliis TaxID=5932 RepID=G0QUB9_ICHMU|nr:hypothetical protein IMG5_116170 [Ichthyophthirius multifiliis]EGR31191.1 hypothetical protein IMG5_116170 [Ichthyophthirius multifiliis]|eukprot:XP_004034677.1 hypothetical protein IMG5_116170 [Ichthyophthirius multifiliis]